MNLTRKKYIIFLLTITCFMVIGFAVLSSSLTINGTSTINSNSWNVKFQNLVLDSTNTVTGTQSIDSDTTKLNFSVNLTTPGDKYSFTIDVVNTGSIDAMINTINKSTLTDSQSKYLEYTVTYSDGVAIQQKDKLVKEGGTETLKITINFKSNVAEGELPTSGDSLNLAFSLNYVQANNTAVKVDHSALNVFIAKAKAGNAESSDVGSTFSVTTNGFGTQTLRVANVSKSSSCNSSNFSKTACGVVLEFVYPIASNTMATSNVNNGGWPSSPARTYINSTIYNSLPTNLKNAIINTTVLTGQGTSSGGIDSTNDKLYLLSPHEIWENGYDNLILAETGDRGWDVTRQLDYYRRNSVNTNNYNVVARGIILWLRTPYFNNSTYFFIVKSDGDWDGSSALTDNAITPAFRIA